jgi:hypothetical protein
LEVDNELRACFIDWQKAFEGANLTKLMHILKKNGYPLTQKKTDQETENEPVCSSTTQPMKDKRVKTGRRIAQGCCLTPSLFNVYSECLPHEVLKWFQYFKTDQVIRTVKQADKLVLQPKEQSVLQGMTDRLIEIGRYY